MKPSQYYYLCANVWFAATLLAKDWFILVTFGVAIMHLIAAVCFQWREINKKG